MSLSRLMLGSGALLFVTGCSHLPWQPVRHVAQSPVGADYEVVEEPSDQARPHRRVRTRVAMNHSTGTEPLLVLQQSEAGRAKWKTERVNYEKLQPAYLGNAPDPRTTASVKQKSELTVDPAQDAQASMGRLIDNGKKAAAPICQGC